MGCVGACFVFVLDGCKDRVGSQDFHVTGIAGNSRR
jgi:hypothetical protein